MTRVRTLKTYVPRPQEIQPRWHLINAEGQVLGRLATRIARILQGKDKATYTPHLPTGDFVVVINAAKVVVTGKKMRQKIYYFHSGYPGGLREFTLEQMLQRDPTRVIKLAVRRMLPKSNLGRKMLSRLKVYAGPEHPHQAQIAGFPAQNTSEEVNSA
ncbi:MAG: 50S ribosomal protein L13 [Dehalococcoidia bacterium]|nr:50S ribosomal protein L13 [Dehalococcoidia bacterium]MDW8119374.1 50S ribosomal protein L13 [Chloroflexota bacterium]